MAPGPIPESVSPIGRTNRRSILAGMGAGLGGLAVGGIAGDKFRQSESQTVDSLLKAQEERDDAIGERVGMSSIIWSVPAATDAVALTFDDGPDPQFTPTVLDILRRFDAKATFMMMGHNVEQHQDLAKRVVAEGHEVGNHSWSHLNMAKTAAEVVQDEVRRGTATIERVTGQRVRYFRPPRGELPGCAVRCAAQAQQSILMWSLNGGLPVETSSDQVRDHLVSGVRPGDVVLLHDGIGRGTFNRTKKFAEELVQRRTFEVAALPSALETLTARGLRFVTVSQLLAEPRT